MNFALIETALGTMGLGWSAHGVARFALPGDTRDGVRGWMRRYGTEAELPEAYRPLATRVTTYAEGGRVSFDAVELDLAGVPEFHRRVYDDIRQLGWGETTTYGAIARRLGDVQLARAVGQAMGANPIPLIVPCHRVLAAAGRSGGFSAPGGVGAKMRMLALERASTPDGQFGFGF